MENAVNTKLAINLSEGTVEVEGTEDFVRYIYQDFKESLSKHVIVRQMPPPPPLEQEPERRLITNDSKEHTEKPPAEARKKSALSGEKRNPPSATYKPTFNSKLNLTGLDKFYDDLKPENNTECIAVFAAFLRERLQLEKCTANDIHTCFFTLKSRVEIPTALPQAIKNAKHRTHYIDYDTYDSIELTIAGHNWLEQQVKKVKEQAK